MTYQGKQISWLEYRSQVTGKSVDELRKEMSERSKLANKKTAGFASMDKKTLLKVSASGGKAGKGVKRGGKDAEQKTS